ncbi:hypothetical protein [uncultured Psychrobacter sp.]|uniref:DUF4870 family protein n=1 Tax=unclassified Psychrobacter TaxID=196806 RepID=UPI00293D27C7|nr:hypothetical protein [uncultured Psychrobacter sp.]
MSRNVDSNSEAQTRRTKTAEIEALSDPRRFDVQKEYGVARQNAMSNKKQRSLIAYNHLTYLLYVVSYFTAGLLWVVPIVMNYSKRQEADGSWLATHFDWQIKTFWYSIVWFVIGIVIVLFALSGFGVSMMLEAGDNLAIGSILLTGFGLIIIIVTFIWHLYRIVRGWIALTDNRPVP